MNGVQRDRSAWLWMVLVGGASLGLSRALACVTPFAAIAVLAAFTLPRRLAVLLVVFCWAANQAIGFGLLHYPVDAPTIGWGAAIGVAALAGLVVATAATRLSSMSRPGAMMLAVPLAFAAYEGVLLLATAVLPSGPGAFTQILLLQMLAWNAAAVLALMIPYRLAFGSGHGPLRSPAAS